MTLSRHSSIELASLLLTSLDTASWLLTTPQPTAGVAQRHANKHHQPKTPHNHRTHHSNTTIPSASVTTPTQSTLTMTPPKTTCSQTQRHSHNTRSRASFQQQSSSSNNKLITIHLRAALVLVRLRADRRSGLGLIRLSLVGRRVVARL